MAGSWEIIQNQQVLVVILTREITSVAWALGFRALQIPGSYTCLSGMPFDHARNVGCQKLLELGWEWCFRGDTLVETISGPKKIKNIKVGDYVKTHKNRYREVLKTIPHLLKQDDEILWVKTENSTLKCTPVHPFFIYRNGEYNFIRAKNLIPGDMALYPNENKKDKLNFNIKFNSNGPNNDGKKGSKKYGKSIDILDVDETLARFLGLYLAEGCGGHDSIRFTFGNHEQELINFICNSSKTIFDRKPTIHKRWATTVKINVKALSALFTKWFGKNAREKKIPEFVFDWSLKNKLKFLYAYLEGDGAIKTKNWSFRTASKELADGIVRLSKECGLLTKICSTSPTSSVHNGIEIHGHSAYQGWIAQKSRQKIIDLLSAKQVDNYLHMPITAIEEHKMPASLVDYNVYNLEVDEDESYIADCASVHNCFFLDDDVIVPPDAILRLMAHKKPIVSGLYYRRNNPICPVMLKNLPTGGRQWITEFKTPDLMEVDFVGAGCLLIHKSVLTSMAQPWFEWNVDKDLPQEKRMSEDFSFCEKARQHGHKILVDTSILCVHCGLSQAVLPGKLEPLELMH